MLKMMQNMFYLFIYLFNTVFRLQEQLKVPCND